MPNNTSAWRKSQVLPITPHRAPAYIRSKPSWDPGSCNRLSRKCLKRPHNHICSLVRWVDGQRYELVIT